MDVLNFCGERCLHAKVFGPYFEGVALPREKAFFRQHKFSAIRRGQQGKSLFKRDVGPHEDLEFNLAFGVVVPI